MSEKSYIAIALAAAILGLTGGPADAQHGGGGHFGGGAAGGHFGGFGAHAGGSFGRAHLPTEAFPGPSHYHGVAPPAGWNDRPGVMDRGAYQHDYQASRAFKIGPYHPPRSNWHHRHHVYGDFLPAAFWASDYVIDDYWLFSLETPPVGCEWVRYGDDAMLIDTSTGEIIQAVYGVFA